MDVDIYRLGNTRRNCHDYSLFQRGTGKNAADRLEEVKLNKVTIFYNKTLPLLYYLLIQILTILNILFF